jgi:hypothetical protein
MGELPRQRGAAKRAREAGKNLKDYLEDRLPEDVKQRNRENAARMEERRKDAPPPVIRLTTPTWQGP